MLSTDEARALVNGHDGWHHRFEIYPGVMTPGASDPREMWTRLGLPDDLRGMTALDIGAADGFFSRELDKRGAKVTALDYKPKHVSGFAIMERLYGKPLTHLNANISSLPTLGLAPFDIVLFLGVLYHLPDPVRALWDIRQIVKGELLLESYVEHFSPGAPAARYYERDRLGNDITNFWAPNPECIESMLRDVGFALRSTEIAGDRALYHAHAIDLGPNGNVKMMTAYGFLQVRQKYLPR